MPTVLRIDPYRFYFVSHDVHEPPHIHVDRDSDSAKFWLGPVALASNIGFRTVELRRVQRLVVEHESRLVDLLDGRTISVPLVWYPRLLSATPEQRANWRIAGGGFGIHWPDVDEDLSTDGLLRGAPAPRGSAPTSRASS
jgi:hypothetical protein